MQTKNRTNSRFSEIADERFNYDLTEETYRDRKGIEVMPNKQEKRDIRLKQLGI